MLPTTTYISKKIISACKSLKCYIQSFFENCDLKYFCSVKVYDLFLKDIKKIYFGYKISFLRFGTANLFEPPRILSSDRAFSKKNVNCSIETAKN